MYINNSGNLNKKMVKFNKIRMEFCQIIIKFHNREGVFQIDFQHT